MTYKIIRMFLLCIVKTVMSVNVPAFAEYKFICPTELAVRQSVARDVAGWQKNSSHKSHPFMDVSIFGELPNKRSARQTPTGNILVESGFTTGFKLPKSSAGYWVSCVYKDTSVTVTQKLPDDVAYCEVEYGVNFSYPARRWHCLSEAELTQAEAKNEKREIKTKNKKTDERSFNICPPRLTVQHDITQDVPDDWQKHDDRSSHPFVNVMFSEGSPDLQIILAPTRKKKVKSESIAEWELPGSAVGYWVSCLYNGTSATIARKLPGDVAYCEVRYDKAYSSPNVEKWRCLSDAQLKQGRKEK